MALSVNTPPWFETNGEAIRVEPPDSSAVPLTVSDESSTRTLSPPELHAWAIARIEYHKEYIRRLSAIQNASALFHQRMPSELLVEIFDQVHPSKRKGIRLLHVCRLWRSLALKTPGFWVSMLTNILINEYDPLGRHPTRNKRYIQAFAELSSPRPFAVPLNSRLSCHVFAPHFSRISSLTIHITLGQAAKLYERLSLGMPQLKTLVIKHILDLQDPLCDRDDWNALRLTQIPADAFKSLDELKLPSTFFIPLPPMPTLGRLVIGGCRCRKCNSVPDAAQTQSDIFAILRQCPALASVSIEATTCGSHPRPPLQQVQPVHLPYLSILELSVKGMELVSAALGGHVEGSADATLIFHVTLPRGRQFHELSLPHFNHPVVASLETICFDFGTIPAEDDLRYRVRGTIAGNLRFYLDAKGHIPDADVRGTAVNNLFDTISPQGLQSLTLGSLDKSRSTPGITLETFTKYLSRIPSLATLKLLRFSSTTFITEAVRLLAHRTSNSSNLGLCPELKKLDISFRCTHLGGESLQTMFDGIESMLASRAPNGLEILVVQVYDVSSISPRITGDSLKKKLLRRFRRHVGDVRVTTYRGDIAYDQYYN